MLSHAFYHWTLPCSCSEILNTLEAPEMQSLQAFNSILGFRISRMNFSVPLISYLLTSLEHDVLTVWAQVQRLMEEILVRGWIRITWEMSAHALYASTRLQGWHPERNFRSRDSGWSVTTAKMHSPFSSHQTISQTTESETLELFHPLIISISSPLEVFFKQRSFPGKKLDGPGQQKGDDSSPLQTPQRTPFWKQLK